VIYVIIWFRSNQRDITEMLLTLLVQLYNREIIRLSLEGSHKIVMKQILMQQ